MKARGALGLVAAAALFAAPAAAAPKELGLNIHQSTDVGLEVTKSANLKWVRIDVNWFAAEPTQGVYDWAVLDQVIDGAKSRGLSVLAVLAYTPAWASQGNVDGKETLNDVPKAGTYAAFVTAAVTHFAGRVAHYELWNEPNLGQFFEGTPADYTARVLVPGADAVHAACASCKVVAPGLASLAVSKYDEWLDASLTAAMPKIDIVSGHVYAGFPQDGAAGTSDNFYQRLEKHRVVKIGDVVAYEGPRAFKEVMDAHGAKQPFWLTETGTEAALGDAPALDAQTKFYRRVLESMLTRAWWTNTIFYEAFDESSQPYRFGVALHGTGASFTEKPVMALLRQATSKQLLFGGTGTDCEDGLDNEGDGKIDFPADPDCTSAKSTSEGAPPIDAGDVDAGDADAGTVTDGGGGGCNGSGGTAPSGAGAGALALVLAAALARRRVGAR